MQRGLGIIKGFDVSRRNGCFICVTQGDGLRPKQYFESLKDRDAAFAKKFREVRTHGADVVAALPGSSRQAIVEMEPMAAGSGLTPMEIFQRGLVQVAGGTASARGTSTGDAMTAFLAAQDTRFADGKISSSRHKEIRLKAERFRGTLSKKPLVQCTRTAVRTYLRSLKVEPQTRMNYARNLAHFFNWAVDEDLIFKNPVPGQEGMDRIPTVFGLQQVADLIDCTRQHYPALLPMLGLQWYAGLRPGATHHMTWQDIDFAGRRLLSKPQRTNSGSRI